MHSSLVLYFAQLHYIMRSLMQKYCLSQNLNYLQSKYKNILKSEKIFIFYIRQKILFIKNHIRW